MNTEKNIQNELFTLPKTQSEKEFNALWTRSKHSRTSAQDVSYCLGRNK
ncbi:hypothetical protein [Psychromonas sp. KJ10-2]